MVNHQAVHSKAIHQLLRHFRVGEKHELLHEPFTLYSFFQADIDGDIFGVELEDDLVSVEHGGICPSSPPYSRKIFQNLNLPLHSLKLLQT